MVFSNTVDDKSGQHDKFSLLVLFVAMEKWNCAKYAVYILQPAAQIKLLSILQSRLLYWIYM